ncbi:MarR family transcriptional regulator [Roseibium hamelinense]|uniref:MarR family transcriptional regulator n=1 Tax=Roseibium hamelinense TaxID=150831 RepID=A0A562T8L2_9HYPH|nr:MarR family winged helix-turn-helix transcriptional regulator [Roseibium hamelinense]MTI42348.1 MarR family transcriptional regulator [Roseibium hamelinense]TWI89564.1 MarR family transcriptional regulator [Roseibium hamelinense]
MDNADRHLYFSFFNEVNIIGQLSRAQFEARLPKGVLLPHFSVLNHLVRVGDGATPLALARAFQVPKTTMTHTVSGLVQRAFVTLKSNPKDGRSKTVWLTNAGREFRDDAIKLLDDDMEALRAAIPADKISALVPALEEIRVFLDAYRNEPEDP